MGPVALPTILCGRYRSINLCSGHAFSMRLTRTLIENRDKVVLAPASSAYKHSLKEVLSSPGIAARIKNTKAAKEVEALQVGA